MLPPAVDIPTGLGKTAVMAIWLLARAAGAALPRRLVYVVDRRAVVDQATEFAEQLRKRLEQDERLDSVRSALGLGKKQLPISTLRGRHVDNREWMADPATEAIVVGTVDMVGSRLLFEGYGLSRRMRPFVAGLLGCDTLVLLDEAHLARPFERLLKTIETGRRPSAQGADGLAGTFAGPAVHNELPPPFHVLPLSATLGRESDGSLFRLNDDDRRNGTVRARLEARKRLTVEDLSPDLSLDRALADRAWELMEAACANAGQPPAVAVYCDRRTDAGKVADDLRKRTSRERPRSEVILLVGGRRVRERQKVTQELQGYGLVGESPTPRRMPVFLVATSAGEVGVDLDADHMVCDLVAWERMVQRLGRVNRRGRGDAMVRVIDQDKRTGKPDKNSRSKTGTLAVARHEAARSLLYALPLNEAGERQAGPGALENLATDPGQHAQIAEATTRMPLYPALTRPLVDAWAMTALEDHAGRPEVGPWLRGWVEDDEPQTAVVWRRYLPLRFRADGGAAQAQSKQAIRAFFAAAPPQTTELLETETSRVAEWLTKRARKQLKVLDKAAARTVGPSPAPGGDSANDGEEATEGRHFLAPLTGATAIAFLLDAANRPAGVLSLAGIDKSGRKNLNALLAGKRLVVDARFGGIKNGLLDETANDRACTVEDNWGQPEEIPWNLKVEACSDDVSDSDGWQAVLEVPYCVSAEDEARTRLIVWKRRGTGESEDARAVARKAQRLDEHQEWAGKEAARIADALGLPEADRAMLVAAARHHDDGKAAKRWQEAFNAPSDWRKGGPYAKTSGPFNRQRLNGYRHEFKSVLDAERVGLGSLDRADPRFELALHLIAAHHGRARPGIGIEGCDAVPPSAAEQGARTIALRFARLQRGWGPWGLAWWEALLRAADQAASRRLDDNKDGAA